MRYVATAVLNVIAKIAARHGVDLWDTMSLPYGQFNGEEAFADCFAAYHVSPRELKTRYPRWVKIVKDVIR